MSTSEKSHDHSPPSQANVGNPLVSKTLGKSIRELLASLPAHRPDLIEGSTPAENWKYGIAQRVIIY